MIGESKVHAFVHCFDGRHLCVDIYVRVIDECVDEAVIGCQDQIRPVVQFERF